MESLDEHLRERTGRVVALGWALRVCGLLSLVALLGLGWLAAAHLSEGVAAPGPRARIALLVLVSAGVGFTTNWLAIKMLFRPRRRRDWLPLWPQGLLPREQQRFARALGRVAAQRLLSAEAVSAALEEEQLRVPLGQALRAELDALLAAPATRRLLARYVTDGIRTHGPSLVRRMRPELRAAIEQHIEEHLTAERILAWIEAGVAHFARSIEMRRALARWIFRETSREGVVTHIMQILQDQFHEYRRRHPIRGFLAEQFVIDWDAARESLIAMLRSDAATDDLAQMLTGAAQSIIERLRQPTTAEAAARVRGELVDRLLGWFEREGVAIVADRVARAADNPETWTVVEGALDELVSRVPEALFEPRTGRLRAEIREHLHELQARLVALFPIAEIVEKQVLAMDPAAIESLVDEIGRRELAWIQILGYILGALAGLMLGFLY